uniref:Orf535 n=1 Tax=Laurentiella strenua TaxID=114681 RepID=A0A2I4PER1_9SPIT|nr:orf535 [Laurentiella strenua]
MVQLVEQWIVAPKVEGSSPSSYPLQFLFFKIYNRITFNIQNLHSELIKNFLIKTFFFKKYFKLNDLIWQEGLLFDFLQKKTIDNWIKKFLIFSAYLFNERLVFDKIVKFFINLVIIPFQKIFIFEYFNISNLLFINIFFFFLIFFFLIFFLFFKLIF